MVGGGGVSPRATRWVMGGEAPILGVPVMCLQTQRLAQLFIHKEGFRAVKVTNLMNSKILIGHPMGHPMAQSTALLDNTQSSVLRLLSTIYKSVLCKIWLRNRSLLVYRQV